MKILHVMNDSVPVIGGYTTRSRFIVNYQRQVGMEPFVITSVRQGPTKTGMEEIEGVDYFRTNWPKRSLLKRVPIASLIEETLLLYRNIQKTIEKVSPDIIHAHSPILCAVPALAAAKKNGIPIVYEIRAFWEDAAVASNKFKPNSLKYRLIRMLETITCRHVNRVVSISPSMEDDLEARGISKKKLFVIPNGVDGSKFESHPKNPALITQLGLNGKTVIGYLGTFFDFEGIDDLIRAFTFLRKQEKDVVLLLIGEGEKEQSIREQIGRLGDINIIFIGKVPPETTPDYYALMDILVYPRKSLRITEMTTPLKPLEAMALGKPVICSDVGGLKEIVGEGNGLFFEAGNNGALADCCKQLTHNPSLATQLAAAGKNRALRERNWSNLVNRYFAVYDFGEITKS